MKVYLKLILALFGISVGTVLGLSCKKAESRPSGTPAVDEEETDPSVGVLEYKGKWYRAGDTVFGHKNYIFLVVGDADAPLLLGVPHDGVDTGNPAIPETGTTGRDLNTLPFATAIAKLFDADTKKKSWMIVNKIARRRVDPNTYPSETASRYRHADALATYTSYHELLSLARAAMAKAQLGGKGALFLDVHGHAHRYADGHEEDYTSITSGNSVSSNFIDQTEVGYGLSNFALEQGDSYIDQLADSASIAYLAKQHASIAFSKLVRGEGSFGSLLHAERVKAVPSVEIPLLERNALLFGTAANGRPERRPYFNGGYCTRKYGTIVTGSTTGFNDNVVSIQIETPGITVRNNSNIIQRSSHQFKRAVINYLNKWFGYDYFNAPYPY